MVFQTGHGRLGTQPVVLWPAPGEHFHGTVIAERIAVVGILISAGNLSDTLPYHLPHRMEGEGRIPPVGDCVGKSIEKIAVYTLKKYKPSIGGEVRGVKINLDFLVARAFSN